MIDMDLPVINRTCRFAVIQLNPGTEAKLLQLLLDHGYSSISFTNGRGELVGMANDEHDDQTEAIDRERLNAESKHGGSDGAHSDNDDSESTADSRRDASSEDLLEEESTPDDLDESDINVEDTDADEELSSMTIEEEQDDEIEKKEKEVLESFYSEKSISDHESSNDVDDEKVLLDAERQQQILQIQQQQRKFLEQLKEQQEQIQSVSKCESQTPPMEFSSLTLPTVLWGAATEPATLPYNPFLSTVNHFLPYLSTSNGSSSSLPDPLTMPPAATEALAALWSRQHQMIDTPPATPRALQAMNSVSDSNCLITGAKLRQRGRQLRRHERDSSAYASCRLCRNRILANRLSNLHNHVRRHAVMKQFHCCYCSYAHTEVAKVRLHMLHNHKDDRSQPLDKRNDDMEAAWSMLMRECFPGYA